MIELNANGITLDIVDISFSFTMQSAIGGLSGSYIYNFIIPNTIKNCKAFGFPNRLTKFQPVQNTVKGSVIGNGITVLSGTWFASTSKGKTISISMYIGASEFNNIVHDKKLPELFDVEIIYPDIVTHIQDQVTKTFPEVNHNWPTMYNPSFYGEGEDKVNPDYAGIINDWEAGEVHVSTNNNNVISPQLYYGYMIKRIFEYAGYTVVGNVFLDPNFKIALAYNNFALDKLVPSKFQGSVINYFPIYYAYVIIWNKNIIDPGNHYNTSTGEYLVDKEGNYKIDLLIWFKEESLPTTAEEARVEIYYGNTIIHEYQKPYAFGTHSHFLMDETHTELILQVDTGENIWCKFIGLDENGNPVGLNIETADITIQNLDAVDNNTFSNTINYKNHVKDMDTKAFLSAFFSTAKIVPVFHRKRREVSLTFIDDLLGSNRQSDFNDGIYNNSIQLTHKEFSGLNFTFDFQGPDKNLDNNFIDILQSPVIGSLVSYGSLVNGKLGDIYFIENLNCYYIYALITEATDTEPEVLGYIPYSDNQYPVIVGDGDEDVSISIAPMLMRAYKCPREDNFYRLRNLPSVDAEGSSIGFGMLNDFPLRIMFWFGIIPTEKDVFPIATTSKQSIEGTPLMPINWSLEEILPNYLSNFIIWKQKRIAVQFDRKITYADIANFDLSICGNVEGALILLDSMQAKLKSNEDPKATFKGWTK